MEILICIGLIGLAVTGVVVLVGVVGSINTGREYVEKMDQLRRQRDGR